MPYFRQYGKVVCRLGFSSVDYYVGLQAHIAQLVERVLGKDEVSGSIPLVGSKTKCKDNEVPPKHLIK